MDSFPSRPWIAVARLKGISSPTRSAGRCIGVTGRFGSAPVFRNTCHAPLTVCGGHWQSTASVIRRRFLRTVATHNSNASISASLCGYRLQGVLSATACRSKFQKASQVNVPSLEPILSIAHSVSASGKVSRHSSSHTTRNSGVRLTENLYETA